MSTVALPLSSTSASTSSVARTLRIFVGEVRYLFFASLRTRAFSLSVIGFPLMFYLLFGLVMNHGQADHGVLIAKYMLASYATFGIVGASLFGIGVGLALDLAAGWLELKRASPMPPFAYLGARCVNAMAFGVIIVSLLCCMGMAFGGVHLTASEFGKMIALTVVGVVPFASLGFLLALYAPATSAPGIANLLYLPMSFLSGLWVPIENLPKILREAAPLLPAYHLAQLFESIFHYQQPEHSLTSHWVGLCVFAVLAFGLAGYAFHRREQNA